MRLPRTKYGVRVAVQLEVVGPRVKQSGLVLDLVCLVKSVGA